MCLRLVTPSPKKSLKTLQYQATKLSELSLAFSLSGLGYNSKSRLYNTAAESRRLVIRVHATYIYNIRA